jgi:outer membrane protein insertion porin family
MLIICQTSLAWAEGARINDFKYIGNERVSNQTIFAYVEMNVGDNYDQHKADESVKSLFKTGLFSDVKIFMKGNILVIEVVENALINKVAFDGNKNIEDSDLLGEMTLKPRSILSTEKVQEDVRRIVIMYQRKGYFSVRVEPKIIKLDQNRVNLVYEIHEDKEAVIKKINFYGNENFSDAELADMIASKEYRWFRFFSSAHLYDPEKQKFDEELINRFYKNRGYADARVTSKTAELSQKRDAFLLTFVIHEGEIYTYGNVEIDNRLQKFDHRGLESILLTKSGKTFNQEEIDETVELLTNELGTKGFPFVDVEPSIKTNKTTKTANIVYHIKEGYRVYINKINIKNNTRTLDNVIRREFRIVEGDPYNVSKIQRSKQRIENLGYFNKVEFKNKRSTDPDKMDIDVEVEETSTGSLNFAAGYNTNLGPLGQVSITEKNFLGKGQEVGLSFMQAKKSRNITFSFDEPHFLDKDHLRAGFDIFTQNTNYKSEASYNSRKVGGVLRLGYDITEHLFHGVRYSLVKEEITNVASNASIYIKNQKGRHVNSSVGQTLGYDRMDSRIDPTSGYFAKIDQDVAGLGGSVRYISHTVEGRFYYPLYKKDLIFLLKAQGGNRMGYGGKKLNINDAFYMGGDMVRGFDRAGIGPRSKKEADALGGKNYYAGTAEINFPVGLPKEVGVKGGVFLDAGSLWGTDIKDKAGINDRNSMRASYGASLYWKSPMGPIGVHYGIPLKKEKFDDLRKFDLNFTAQF